MGKVTEIRGEEGQFWVKVIPYITLDDDVKRVPPRPPLRIFTEFLSTAKSITLLPLRLHMDRKRGGFKAARSMVTQPSFLHLSLMASTILQSRYNGTLLSRVVRCRPSPTADQFLQLAPSVDTDAVSDLPWGVLSGAPPAAILRHM